MKIRTKKNIWKNQGKKMNNIKKCIIDKHMVLRWFFTCFFFGGTSLEIRHQFA